MDPGASSGVLKTVACDVDVDPSQCRDDAGGGVDHRIVLREAMSLRGRVPV